MNALRRSYVDASRVALDLLACPEVAARWEDESVLPEFAVRGLAGHLARAVLQVEWFLDAPEPDGPPITAVTYYAELVGVTDPSSDLNVGVRARGEEVADAGPAALVEATSGCLERLGRRLELEPDERRLSAFGRTLVLDEYLRTRLVELTVHIDDLAISVDVAPSVPAEAYAAAMDVLVAVGRRRHGDLAVLRALTRRERDQVEALRVL
jgi:hypothetical protein